MIQFWRPKITPKTELMDMRKTTHPVFLVILAFGLTACLSETPTPTPVLTTTVVPAKASSPTPSQTVTSTATVPAPTATETNTPTPEILAYGPDNFPSDVNPLTGLRVSDPTRLDRRPLSVKVQLFPRGQRPPYGVSLADLVFDYYQNSGLTRLHAIFYGQDAERVSPVRSARLFDGELVQMYKSVFAFGGADRFILNRLFTSEYGDRLVVEGPGSYPAMKRIDPNGLNYLSVKTAELSQYASGKPEIDNSRQNLKGMTFNSVVPAGGDPGEELYVRYSISSYVRWDYDQESGGYLRYQDTREASSQAEEDYGDEPMTDGSTKILAANVLVLKVTHENIKKTGGNEIIEIHLDDSGQGYAFRDGKRFNITWNRPPSGAMLTFTLNEDGTEASYHLKPGNIWIQIIGQSSGEDIQADGALRFTFSIP
jgi:hypothetical protein